MKVTRSQLRRIIREERNRLLSEQNNTGPYNGGGVGDAGDEVLRVAMDIFGGGALVDERDGEVVIDTGVTDTDIEELYDEWIYEFPDAVHEEGGLIYTGVMV
tara:strand:- start:1402 stop:1707 length:306 start_codon:yes stop_codon:yes gene_type:complete